MTQPGQMLPRATPEKLMTGFEVGNDTLKTED